METIVKLFITGIIVFMVFSCETENGNDQKNQIIIDSWLFVKVDSCAWHVTPATDTLIENIANNEGVIEFRKDGSGVLDSSFDPFCGYKEFEWDYPSSAICFKVNGWQFPYSQVTIINRDTLALSIDNYPPRIGLSIWYEVTLARIQAKD